MTNPITGARYFLRGLCLLNRPRVRRYVIIPLLINITLFVIGLIVATRYFNIFVDWAMGELPAWLTWLSWILWPIFTLLCFLVVFFSFSIVANLIGAPFNGFLAQAVEIHITGNKPCGTDRGLLAEIRIALTNELKKILYYLLWAVPLAIISLIFAFIMPLFSPVTPFIWLLFGAWIMSIEYADYPMGNHGISFVEIRRKLSQKRLLTLGYGGTTLLATLIPVFNFLVMPAAVAGATAMWVEEYLKQDSKTSLPEAH